LNNIVTLKSGLEVTQDHSNWYHRKLGCGFLFAFYSMALSGIISEIKWDMKIWHFHIPMHSTPPLGGRRRNIAIRFGTEN